MILRAVVLGVLSLSFLSPSWGAGLPACRVVCRESIKARCVGIAPRRQCRRAILQKCQEFGYQVCDAIQIRPVEPGVEDGLPCNTYSDASTMVGLYCLTSWCAGLLDPALPPRVHVMETMTVEAGGMEYAGYYRGDLREIWVGAGSGPNIFAHEYLHDILCQLGRCDGYHADPVWQRCLPSP